MKKMRTSLAGILCLAMILAFAGCGEKQPGTASANPSDSSASSTSSASSASGTDAKFYDGSRAINLVVPFAAGGGTDLLARTLAANMEAFLPCSINVNNMTGGGAGGTGMAYVMGAAQDGYTIMAGSETSLLVPVMNDLDYTAEDFNFLTAQLGPGGVLVTNKSTGITTMAEALEAAAAQPDQMKISCTNGGLWFAQANTLISSGAKFGVATYDGSASAINACMSNEVAFCIGSTAEVADYIKSGDFIPVTAIASEPVVVGDITIPAVTDELPDMAQYLPLDCMVGLFVPKSIPAEAYAELEAAFISACGTAEMQTYCDEHYCSLWKDGYGDEANQYAIDLQKSLSWLLYDLGSAQRSPEDAGISRP